MDSENEHSYFRCVVTESSLKALQVQLISNGKKHWVPKSLCELKPHPSSGHVLEVEEWFAKKEKI